MRRSIRIVLAVILLLAFGGSAFGQMDMLPQLLRDLPPELQQGLPLEMTYEEYRRLNRNVDFFTMFMSMFVPGYGLFQVEKPGLAWAVVGGRVAGYGMMGLALARQWNDFQDLAHLENISTKKFNNFLTNAFLFGGGIVLNGIGWTLDVIGAYHIAKQEKDFVIYKYGLQESMEGESEKLLISYIRKLILQDDDPQAREDAKKSLYRYLEFFPLGPSAPEAEYHLAIMLYNEGRDAEALIHAGRGVFLYDGNRFTQPLRSLGVEIVQENLWRWSDDAERLMSLTEISAGGTGGEGNGAGGSGASGAGGSTGEGAESSDPEGRFYRYLSTISRLGHPEFQELFPSEAARFLRLFPQTDYGDEVRYLLGSHYEGRHMWEEAVIEYIKSAALYPDPKRKAEAILKAAIIMDEILGRYDYAERYYRRLIDEFPDSSEAEVSRKRLGD